MCSLLYLPDLSFKLDVSALKFDKTGIRLMSLYEAHVIAMVRLNKNVTNSAFLTIKRSLVLFAQTARRTGLARAFVPLIHVFVIFC